MTIARSMAEVGGELIEKDTKTHQVRKVTIDAETTALLVAHRSACEDLVSKCGAKVTANSFLFRTKSASRSRGDRTTPRSPSAASATNSASRV